MIERDQLPVVDLSGLPCIRSWCEWRKIWEDWGKSWEDDRATFIIDRDFTAVIER